MDDKNRRAFLQALATGGAAVVLGPQLVACGAEGFDEESWDTEEWGLSGADTISGKYFKVEVPGMYGDVPDVTAVDPGRINVIVHETTSPTFPGIRTYTYGKHQYEDFTMTMRMGPGNVKLQTWFKQATQQGGSGDALRRDIVVRMLATDRQTVVRTVRCFGAFPTNYNAELITGSSAYAATLTCSVNRIEIA